MGARTVLFSPFSVLTFPAHETASSGHDDPAAAPVLRNREAAEEVELVDSQPLPRERSVGGKTGKKTLTSAVRFFLFWRISAHLENDPISFF